jgi:hypothetical protein
MPCVCSDDYLITYFDSDIHRRLSKIILINRLTRQDMINAIEINPAEPAGSATKKRGIVVRSASELNEFNRILANEILVELA